MSDNGRRSMAPGPFSSRSGHFVLHSGSTLDYDEYEEFLRRYPHNPITTVAGLPTDVVFDDMVSYLHHRCSCDICLSNSFMKP